VLTLLLEIQDRNQGLLGDEELTDQDDNEAPLSKRHKSTPPTYLDKDEQELAASIGSTIDKSGDGVELEENEDEEDVGHLEEENADQISDSVAGEGEEGEEDDDTNFFSTNGVRTHTISFISDFFN
jgi:hypothetical protein